MGSNAVSEQMPNFFLNVRDGDHLTRDVEGTEFADLAAARAEALAAARDVLGDEIKNDQVQDNRQYEITDEAGRVLATVPLMDALKRYGLLALEVNSYLRWMTENPGIHILSDARWAELEPLINEVRPHCKVPHDNLRQTIEAILWRHQNGAKWRAIPGELGPWWKAAQTFIRWGHLGVWERLLELVQGRGVALGMTFLDGTNLRAHQKAAGAKKGGPTARSETAVRRSAARVAAMAPRPA